MAGFWQGVKDLTIGSSGRTEQQPLYSEQTTKDLDLLRSLGMQGLQNTNFNFQPIADQARTNFQTKTVPAIAERFSGMGSGGQRSSAFQSALGSAGSNLESSLASLGQQYNLQNRQQLLGQVGLGSKPQFENLYIPPEPGLLQYIASAFGGYLGSSLGLPGGSRGSTPGLPMGQSSLGDGGSSYSDGDLQALMQNIRRMRSEPISEFNTTPWNQTQGRPEDVRETVNKLQNTPISELLRKLYKVPGLS